MNIILFDDPAIRPDMLPFTFTRPTGKIRVGILTMDEKWALRLNSAPSFLTEPYLQKKFPVYASKDNLFINGSVCADDNLASAIQKLEIGQYLVQPGTDTILASRQKNQTLPTVLSGAAIKYSHPVTIIKKTWDIFSQNAAQLKADFRLITAGRKSHGINDKHTIIYGTENLFVEEGVDVKAAIINAEAGPVYLGKNSVVQEGAIIHGSLALCEGSHLNMGAKMRGDSTIGPFCKVGGEISNSVIFGYSNKAHDGFLGNSVIGEWCNLGADTNTSNLKNNYDMVKLWSHTQETFVSTGLQFCGLMMGDHSKCGINTMFNTGTVVDVFSNIFGEGFPRNYIPSYSWGGAKGLAVYELEKALQTAERVLARRKLALDSTEKEILTHLFNTAVNQNSRTKKL
jgi:UDP-N-acetylglucosamine diphosphorylase/glucosamine-1-phosphate N-acetyltransferase